MGSYRLPESESVRSIVASDASQPLVDNSEMPVTSISAPNVSTMPMSSFSKQFTGMHNPVCSVTLEGAAHSSGHRTFDRQGRSSQRDMTSVLDEMRKMRTMVVALNASLKMQDAGQVE